MPLHVPDTPAAYFEQFFPEQFARNRRHFPPGDTAAATRFRLEGEGSWTLSVEGDALRVRRDDPGEVAMELACTLPDFRGLFVGHLQDEVGKTGRLSEGSLSALRPLVLTDRKRAVCRRTRRTLALELVQAQTPRRLLVTPGGGAATDPGSTVRLSFEDYLRIQTGQRSTTRLFLTRRLRVEGDLKHALKLDPLLG